MLFKVPADRVFDGNLPEYDMIVLPGGMPGVAMPTEDHEQLVSELQG